MDGYAYDTGLLILRVCLGLTMAAHGYNKFFGGGRIPGTAKWFESIGMKPGMLHARIAATTEMAAGLGLAVGLLTPIPAAGFVALMLVAAWTVHRRERVLHRQGGLGVQPGPRGRRGRGRDARRGPVQPGLPDFRAQSGSTAGPAC